MQTDLPRKVTLTEVGPRDGFQFETQVLPIDVKVDVVAGLVAAGLRHIQVVSFVHPARVPQMADAETLLHRLPRQPDVFYNGLVLNERGLERALSAGLASVEISVSASDTHSRRNVNRSFDAALAQGCGMVQAAKKEGLHVRAGVQCALGCVYECDMPVERVVAMLTRFRDLGADAAVVSDTTGMGSPVTVKRLLDRLLPAIHPLPVILHLHDTRGTGLVNMLAGLECGINRFDTALGGMGGCPFIPGAAGNLATEDAVYFLETMGIATGVDRVRVAECALKLEAVLGRQLPGKMLRVIQASAKNGQTAHCNPPGNG